MSERRQFLHNEKIGKNKIEEKADPFKKTEKKQTKKPKRSRKSDKKANQEQIQNDITVYKEA